MVGMPQVSVLGPLLFVLYINDLPNAVKSCHISLYADDTALHYSDSSLDQLQSNLQQDLNSILDWFTCNKITLNLSKSVSMLIGVSQKISGKSLAIKVNDKKITNVDKYRYIIILHGNLINPSA